MDRDAKIQALAWATILALMIWATLVAKQAFPDPLPAQLTLYTPPLYDPFGKTPVPIVSANPDTGSSAAFPRAWLWPTGRFDLTGVFYAFWSPPSLAAGSSALRSHRSVSVNYKAVLPATPQMGDAMTYSGYQDPRMTLFGAFPDDSTVTLKRGGAIITAAADSVIEFRAWIIVRAPNWTTDDSLGTFGRLVPETYRRAVLAGGQP